MLALLPILLSLAAVSDLLDLHSKLKPNALVPPTVSASCKGSGGALGTGNTLGNGFETSIVNIWVIFDSRRNLRIGWIEKTADGRLWYEDPLGLAHVITPSTEQLYLRPDFQFMGCFSKDLELNKL